MAKKRAKQELLLPSDSKIVVTSGEAERAGLTPDLVLWQSSRSFEPNRKWSLPIVLAFAVCSRQSE